MANVKLTAKEDQFVASMKRSSGAVGELAAKINVDLVRSFKEGDKYQREFNRGIVRFGNDLKSTGQELMYVSAAVLGVGAAGFKAFAELQAVQKGLEVVEGGAEAAFNAFARVRDIAKQPGLGMLEAAQGYTNLRAVGFGAEFAEEALKKLGNAIAISGKGKFEFGSVLSQFQQMSSKASVLAEDLKPILNAAPIIARTIMEMYGSVNPEDITKTLQAQGKGPKDFIKDLVTELGKIPSVAGGAKNAIENFGDNVMIAGANLGEVINNSSGLTNSIDNLGETLVEATEWFKGLTPEMQNMIVMSGSLALGIGPVIYGVGALTTSIPKLIGGLSSTTLVTGGVVTAITALSAIIVMAYQDTKRWEDATKPLIKTINDSQIAIGQQTNDLYKYAKAINTSESSTTQFKTAKNELIKINPEFKKVLEGNTISMSAFNDMVEKTNTNLMRQAAAKSLMAQLDQVNQKLENLRNNKPGINAEADLMGQTLMRPGVENARNRRKQLIFDQAKELFEIRNELISTLNNSYSDIYNALNGNTQGSGTPETPKGEPKVIKEAKKAKENIKKAKEIVEESIEDILNTLPEVTKEAGNKLNSADIGLGNLFDNMPTLNMDMSDAERNRELMNDIYNQYLNDLQNFKNQFGYILKDGMADSIGNFFEGLASGRDVGESFKGAMGSLVSMMGGLLMEFGKKALLAEKAIAAVKATFGTGPWAAIGAIALGGVLKGVGKNMSVPKFAAGGMVSGQMLAMVGDNYSGKEAIIPFEKMGSFLKMANKANGGGEGVTFVPSLKFNMRDFIIEFKRAEAAM